MALISKIVLSPLDSENYPGSVLTGHMNCRLQLCYIGTINGPKCKSHHSLVLRLPYTGSQMQSGNAMIEVRLPEKPSVTRSSRQRLLQLT